jgi:hypothetical protein
MRTVGWRCLSQTAIFPKASSVSQRCEGRVWNEYRYAVGSGQSDFWKASWGGSEYGRIVVSGRREARMEECEMSINVALGLADGEGSDCLKMS